jgi:hypothetical protein
VRSGAGELRPESCAIFRASGLNIMAAVSQWEREAIGERTRDALRHKRGNGERVGNIEFGCRLADDGQHLTMPAGRQIALALNRQFLLTLHIKCTLPSRIETFRIIRSAWSERVNRPSAYSGPGLPSRSLVAPSVSSRNGC